MHAAVDREELGIFMLGGGEVQGVVSLLPAKGTGDIEGARIAGRRMDQANGHGDDLLDEPPSFFYGDLLAIRSLAQDRGALCKQPQWCA